MAREAATGKAYLHTSLDVSGRPVIIVRAAKHFTGGRRGGGGGGCPPGRWALGRAAAAGRPAAARPPPPRSLRDPAPLPPPASCCCADTSNLAESQRLCVHLMDKALERLEAEAPTAPDGSRIQTVLGIFDLRGFTSANADWGFVRFLVDIFFLYYPKARPD